MLKFLADEYVPRPFSSQLRLHLPSVDIVRVVDVGLGQTPDPVILQWAADCGLCYRGWAWVGGGGQFAFVLDLYVGRR